MVIMSGKGAAEALHRELEKRILHESKILEVEKKIINDTDVFALKLSRSKNVEVHRRIATKHLRLLSNTYQCRPGNYEQVKYKNTITDIRNWTAESLDQYFDWMSHEFRGFLLADDLGIGLF